MFKAVACSFIIFLRLFLFLILISTSEFVKVELTISHLNAEPFEFVCFGFQEALINIVKASFLTKAGSCLVRG